MVGSAAMGTIPLSGIVIRDSIILVGVFELAIRHERPPIDAILETGVALKGPNSSVGGIGIAYRTPAYVQRSLFRP
jgi:hypothetical protein